MQIVWTQPALTDVLEAQAYVAADSLRYGQLVAERIFEAVEQLEAFPLSGRVVPELRSATVRELIAAPYRIVYRVHAEVLEIIAVVHSARQFPVSDVRARP